MRWPSVFVICLRRLTNILADGGVFNNNKLLFPPFFFDTHIPFLYDHHHLQSDS